MRSIEIEEKERVVKYFRKHFFFVFKKLILASVAIVLGLFLIAQDIRYVSFAGIVLAVLGFGKVLYEFIIWYYDIYVVTSMRIIDINQKGIFRREVLETPLTSIGNISQSTEGVMETFLNFGTVKIQTPGSEVKFEGVSDPAGVQTLIRETLDENLDSG